MGWLERLDSLETPSTCTDITDKSPSVSNVSTDPRRFQQKNEVFMRVVGDETYQLTPEETKGATACNMVTCLRCQNLSRHGVCWPKSTPKTKYRPLEYEPVMLWRRCDDYKRINSLKD